MNGQIPIAETTTKKKGRKLIPALCNIFGVLILISVIASCLPLTVPRLLGYEIYEVVSGSMEPEIPVGSVIYVVKAAPEEIAENEIIAFQSGNSVITHRVVENRLVEGEFITKGDANAKEDFKAASYQSLIGRVSLHIPVMGRLMTLYTSVIGKAYAVCFAACGAMLNMLAGRLRRNR